MLRVENWDGVQRVRLGLLASPDGWTLDVYDERLRLVLSQYTGGMPGGLERPSDGERITMVVPAVEGRWQNDDQGGEFWRVDAPPEPDLVKWIAHRETRQVASEVVVPYDLDPNPVSIAMRLRKRIYDEKFARENPGFVRR